jgi:hypothetical protein
MNDPRVFLLSNFRLKAEVSCPYDGEQAEVECNMSLESCKCCFISSENINMNLFTLVLGLTYAVSETKQRKSSIIKSA